MSEADWQELAAVRSAFCGLIARWRLTQGELRGLLGDDLGIGTQWLVLPAEMGAAAERRMRLLLRFDRAMSGLVPSDYLADWMRVENAACGGSTPLEAMASPEMLRALALEAEERSRATGRARS